MQNHAVKLLRAIGAWRHVELLTAIGSWYGFGLREDQRDLPTLRLGLLRFRVARPHLEGRMVRSVAELRAKANDNRPRANGV